MAEKYLFRERITAFFQCRADAHEGARAQLGRVEELAGRYAGQEVPQENATAAKLTQKHTCYNHATVLSITRTAVFFTVVDGKSDDDSAPLRLTCR